MRAPRTLWAYIAREVAVYTLLGVVAITTVLVANHLLRRISDLIGAGFRIEDLLTILGLFATLLTVYALPISLLFGVLLALGRMSADVELTAMRACGVSLASIATPILVLASLTSAALYPITLEVEPEARREIRTTLTQLFVRGAALEPGRFAQVAGRLVYVDERTADGDFRGIVISDRSSPARPLTIFAERAEFGLDEETQLLTLSLSHGDIHIEDPDASDEHYQRIAFEHFDYKIDLTRAIGGGRQQRAREMTMDTLRTTVTRVASGDPGPYREKDLVTYELHLHRRKAAPLAPVLFAMVAVPIAMRRRRGARAAGMLVCAVLAFGYYALQAFCEFLATQGWFPPIAAPWIPNAGYAALAVALTLRARGAES
jgi:lipopolysaccharide export system permease protein